MRGAFSFAALAVACHTALATVSGAPVVDGEIETAIKTLDDRVEAQTLAKMQNIVEREVVWVAQVTEHDSSQ